MKIHSIKIKNVKSFKSECEVVFDDGLNILIGPNGGGKSNLLTILSVVLNQFFFIQYRFDEQNLTHGKSLRFLGESRAFEKIEVHLDKYIGDKSDSEIVIKLVPDAGDLDNMRRLEESKVAISGALDSFENAPNLTFPENWAAQFSSVDQLAFRISNCQLQSPAVGSPEKSYFMYLRWYSFYRQLAESIEGLELHTPSLFFPPTRSFGALPRKEIGQLRTHTYYEQLASLSRAVSRSNTSMSDIAATHFARKLRKYEIEAARKRDIVVDELFEKDKDVRLLSRYLEVIGYGWDVLQDENLIAYNFTFTKDGDPFDLQKASSGEQELLNLMLGIFSLNVEGGVVLIDEPEVHLHPLWQRILIDLLQELSEYKHVQFIMSTHSPVFVNTDTIDSVIRIYQKGNVSHRVSLKDKSLPAKDALTRLVNSHNNERMLFSDRVVLVEGIKDRIVFQSLIQEISRDYEIRESVEVLEVFGKHNFESYQQILTALEVNHFVIADFDYLEQVGDNSIRTLFDFNARAVDRNVLNNKRSQDGRTLFEMLKVALELNDFGKLQSFCDYLERRFQRVRNPLDWRDMRNVVTCIYKLKSRNIHVLMRGEIENYLPSGTRTTEDVIEVTAASGWIRKSSKAANSRELIHVVFEVLGLGRAEASAYLANRFKRAARWK